MNALDLVVLLSLGGTVLCFVVHSATPLRPRRRLPVPPAVVVTKRGRAR